LVVVVVSGLVLAAWLPSATCAADRVYWTNAGANTISFANLDGSGGGQDLDTEGATVSGPNGLAIDPAAGRIYWSNSGANEEISYADLDGSGGGDLDTAGATLDDPFGIALDPALGRIYWTNANGNEISYANLDGSGGGDLNTTGATVKTPIGLAIEPKAGRVYWGNSLGSNISYANLNGSGGGDLANTSGVPVGFGLAIDSAGARVYWSSNVTSKIYYAALDGTGTWGERQIAGTDVSDPRGMAIDPIAERLYWTNDGINTISFATLGGAGGGALDTSGATALNYPAYPAILRAPAGTAPPGITGGSTFGSTLSCSQGSWALDSLEAFLYRAPQSFGFQWSLDGADVAGATAISHTAGAAGEYRCRVTAQNAAGSTSQTSPPHAISPAAKPSTIPPPEPPSNGFTIGRLRGQKLEVKVPNPGKVAVRDAGKKDKLLKPSSASAASAGNVTVRLSLTKRATKALKRRGSVKVRAAITFTPWGGIPATKTAKLKVGARR
jgi:DNA-binding beta-propeller fold protein YncE